KATFNLWSWETLEPMVIVVSFPLPPPCMVGLIRLRSTPLPRLQGLEYVLNVTATDDNASRGPHSLSSTARVLVGVDDVNNNKPIFNKCQQYRERASVLENQPEGTFVMQVQATDADEGANGKVRYGLMHRDSATVPPFRVHPDTGVMVTAQRFDRERQREYSVTVTATDRAEEPLIGICQLNVQIADLNDNSPKFQNSRYEYFLREDTMVGTSFLRVAALDDDFGTNAAISYSMSLEEPEYLRVNPVTGWVYVNQPISQRTYITREMVATDGGNRSTSVELAVTITNVKNQPPHWETDSYSVVVPENTARDTPIVEDVNDNVPFFTSSVYEASLPEGAQRDTAYVRVFISDVNDNKPVFVQRLYEVAVDEKADVGLVIVTVSANDQDDGANAKLRYQITEGNAAGVFDVEPEVGAVFLAQPLDYERQKRFRLLVLASDGRWEDYAAVVVNVVNRNDEAPVFSMSEYYGSVTEELDGSPVFVLQVTATDPDKDADQGAIRYSIHGQGAESHFVINDMTGEMYAQRTMDREERAVWRFVVMATDEGGEGLTGFTDVTVNIWDINDSSPAFPCSPDACLGGVAENSPPGTFVMEMIAVDPDDTAVGQNAILTYRLTGNSRTTAGVDLFAMDPGTGTVSVAAEGLDRELADRHMLVVEARDGGGLVGTATATVWVTDVNDHVPHFAQERCTASMSEGSEPEAVVLELRAVDPDAGAFGRLAFAVVAGDPERRFYLVAGPGPEQTATLRLKERLDYEAPGERSFNLTVRVEDPEFSSVIHCLVRVEDANDNAPAFAANRLALPPLSEDTAVGTSVVAVTADDADSGPNGDIRYSILAESNPGGHFAVGPTGLVTVAVPLDREAVSAYELVVVAIDQGTPPLTGTVVVSLPLLDVNDNSPRLEAAYSPILWENGPPPQVVWLNRSSTLLGVADGDSPAHGGPFSLWLPPAYAPEFHLRDHGNGTATLTALRSFDRERQREFYLPVIMSDSGHPPMTATNTLTITIGDQNDNAHKAGEKDVFVHSRMGRFPAAIGKVFAPDPDEWDNKTYSLQPSASRYFSLNQSSGALSIRQHVPAGSYWLSVLVSDGLWPDVTSGVRVHVRELEEKAVRSSASVRLTGITAREFIDSRVTGKSRLEVFWDFLCMSLSVSASSVTILGIVDGGPAKTVDVHFSVLTDSGYARPEKLHAVLSAHRKELQSMLRATLSQVEVDECGARGDCLPSGGCSTRLSVGEVPALVDAGGGFSLATSAPLATSAACGCRARERLHRPCSSYPPGSPCLHGGTCVDTQDGYRCRCPLQFEGPDCQQTAISFLGGGYAWFPPMKPCFDSHLSVEFMTEQENGLLLYAGPLAPLLPGEPQDYMAIELIGGTPSLKINHGSATLVLQLPNNVGMADRRWHRLDVRSNSKEVRFTLNRCSSAIVMETEGVDSWAMTEDRSSCEIRGITPIRDRYVDGSPVLQLGGVNQNLTSYRYPQLHSKHFTGCIRNLAVDSRLYDLGSPAESFNSVPGCSVGAGPCPPTEQPLCDAKGHCPAQRGSLGCHCGPGFTGPRCKQAVAEFSFSGRSHAQFQLLGSLPARRTRLQVGVRTRSPGGVLVSLVSPEQNEYFRLEVFQGLLSVFFNLGDGDYNLTLPHHRLDNGDWHEAELDRYGKEFTLRLDGGGGRREVTATPGRSQEIIVDQSAIMIGNSLPSGHNRSFLEGIQLVSSQGVSQGCLSDACRKHHCSAPFVCVDLWRRHDCRCPPGHMARDGTSGEPCVYTLCAGRPCRHGACVPHSPSRYSCRCSEGYRGRHCELTLAMSLDQDASSLSISSMFAICICVLAFLVLMLGLFMYSCWRRHKGLEEGVYHVSTHHGEWEDIRENVLNYDEEGGGEQDQPSPAQSLRYSYPRCIVSYPQTEPSPDTGHRGAMPNASGSAAIALRLAAPTSATQAPPSPLTFRRPGARPSLSFSSQDLARYLCEVIRDTEQPSKDGSRDEVHHAMTTPRCKDRGGLASVRSLSSLSVGQGWVEQGTELGSSSEGGAKSQSLICKPYRFKTLRAAVGELRGGGGGAGDGAGGRGGAGGGAGDRGGAGAGGTGGAGGGAGGTGGAGGGAGAEPSGRSCRAAEGSQKEMLRDSRGQLNCENSG
ncbi:hypothetical protein NHX12_002437, partial [Muraenolepis orangiensis]